jgi:hypothetical protein
MWLQRAHFLIPVRIGILIIGSLWWRGQLRETWRTSRLSVASAILVRAPIHYGRLSSTNTYTMTFAPSGPLGVALVVPCQAEGEHDAVIAEADELWGAEDNRPAMRGRIAKGWGSVGALFRAGTATAVTAAWRTHFLVCGGRPLAAVDRNGLLTIPWPQRVDAQPIECDVLLATTNLETPPVTPERIAEAWIANGDGEYFFENVGAGIRTPDDERIWRRMAGEAAWLGRQAPRHTPAITHLRQQYPADGSPQR